MEIPWEYCSTLIVPNLEVDRLKTKLTMFGLFNKNKSLKPSVTESYKVWVEQSFLWFIENFGLSKRKKEHFHLPSDRKFHLQLENNDDIDNAFELLCEYWSVDKKNISIKIFDDIKSKQWNDWMPVGEVNEPSGTYKKNEKAFYVEIAKSVLYNPPLFISVVSHELAHVKLLGEEYVAENTPDMEFLTDLFVIFCGFGVFLANSCETRNANWISRNGYLPNEVISYANALLCYLTEDDDGKITQELNTNTKSLFSNDFKFIKETEDTVLTKQVINQSKEVNILLDSLDKLIDQKNFTKAEEVCKKLISLKPNETVSFINLGEVLLKQKKYKEAIDSFSKAIDIDPYNHSLFNSRGYCFLQIGDFENAKIDLKTSDELLPENAYFLRNNGVLHLLRDQPEKALISLKEAYKKDPKLNM